MTQAHTPTQKWIQAHKPTWQAYDLLQRIADARAARIDQLVSEKAKLIAKLKNLVQCADAYSDEMTKIGRGHMELGRDAPSYSVSFEARALLAELDKE